MANFAQKMKIMKASSSACSRRNGFLGKVFEGGLAHPPRPRGAAAAAATMELRTSRYFSSAGRRSFVKAFALPRTTPWLMLTPEIDPRGNKIDSFYSLTGDKQQVFRIIRERYLGVPDKARCFGSSRGWLGFIDPNDCSVYLTNPFGRVYSTDSFFGLVEHLPTLPSTAIVKHLSLSCDAFSFDDDPEVPIALVVQGGDIPQLSFCRVAKDDTWTTLFGSPVSFPQTTVRNNSMKTKTCTPKLFYSMYSDIVGHGINAWELPPKPWQVPIRLANFMYEEHSSHLHDKFKFKTSECDLRNQCKARRYLVNDNSARDFMLVIRHTTISHFAADDGKHILKEEGCHKSLPCNKTLRFDVYKVDMMKRVLKRVRSIGDRVIFLGLNQSFVLLAHKFPGLKPNSIYFTDDDNDDTETTQEGNAIPYGGHDFGIYNLKDNSIESCYPFNDKIRSPLLWVAPSDKIRSDLR